MCEIFLRVKNFCEQIREVLPASSGEALNAAVGSRLAPPLVRPGKVHGFKKEGHQRNFEEHKCRDEKVAHRKTHELNYNTIIMLIEIC